MFWLVFCAMILFLRNTEPWPPRSLKMPPPEPPKPVRLPAIVQLYTTIVPPSAKTPAPLPFVPVELSLIVLLYKKRLVNRLLTAPLLFRLRVLFVIFTVPLSLLIPPPVGAVFAFTELFVKVRLPLLMFRIPPPTVLRPVTRLKLTLLSASVREPPLFRIPAPPPAFARSPPEMVIPEMATVLP